MATTRRKVLAADLEIGMLATVSRAKGKSRSKSLPVISGHTAAVDTWIEAKQQFDSAETDLKDASRPLHAVIRETVRRNFVAGNTTRSFRLQGTEFSPNGYVKNQPLIVVGELPEVYIAPNGLGIYREGLKCAEGGLGRLLELIRTSDDPGVVVLREEAIATGILLPCYVGIQGFLDAAVQAAMKFPIATRKTLADVLLTDSTEPEQQRIAAPVISLKGFRSE